MSNVSARDLIMTTKERPLLFSNHPIRRFGCSFRRGFVIALGHMFITREVTPNAYDSHENGKKR